MGRARASMPEPLPLMVSRALTTTGASTFTALTWCRVHFKHPLWWVDEERKAQLGNLSKVTWSGNAELGFESRQPDSRVLLLNTCTLLPGISPSFLGLTFCICELEVMVLLLSLLLLLTPEPGAEASFLVCVLEMQPLFKVEAISSGREEV